MFVTKSQRNRGSYWRGWYLGAQLSRNGHDFTLVCPDEHKHLGFGVLEHSPDFRTITLPRLALKTTAAGIVLRSALLPFSNLFKSKDIIHVCAPAFPETYLSSLMARRSKIPLLVDIDDWWGYDPDGRRSSLEARVEETLERHSVANADAVIVASQILGEKIAPHSRYAPTVIPNGIDVVDFENLDRQECRKKLVDRLRLPGSTRILLTAFDSKFINLLKTVMRKVSSESGGIVLVIVGLPPSYPQGDGIIALPKMERKEWLSSITGSDGVIMLMEDTAWERARFPIKLTEYMATGVPIISSAVGESKRILAEAGYANSTSKLLTHNDELHLLDSIQYLLSDLTEAERVAETAMNFARLNLSWERISTDYLKEIDHLLRS